jgi:hypothetical protein
MADYQSPYGTPFRDDEPAITLRAGDPHAPALLKTLAAKHRVTNQPLADKLDAAAARFELWRRSNPAVRL